MFARILNQPDSKSFSLFGPRGTGKSIWVRERFPDAVLHDLLEAGLRTELLAAPDRLERRIPRGDEGWIVLDEVQKVPARVTSLPTCER